MADPTNRDGDGRGVVTSLTRRTVLATIGAGTVGSAIPAGVAAGETTEYWVVQGDRCIPVTPLSGDVTVEELYDLRIPPKYTGDNGATGTESPWFTSVGTRDLQAPETTITFLYDGPEGLSLVVVHEGVGSDGGSATWTVSGIPPDGEWAVKDDYYLDPETGERADSNFDRWDLAGDPHVIDWTWGDDRTDGGAFRGLGSDFSLTIHPAYNEEAALWEEFYSGRVEDWHVLSGSIDAPERHSLALDRPVTVTTGTCGVEVDIDVRPQSNQNPINPRSRDAIPVLVFDAGTVDLSTVVVDSLRFGPPRVVDAGAGASPVHSWHGGDTLGLYFSTPETGFRWGDAVAKLVGETRNGTTIFGTDRVRLVGNRYDRANNGGGDDERNDGGNWEYANGNSAGGSDSGDGGDGGGRRRGGRRRGGRRRDGRRRGSRREGED